MSGLDVILLLHATATTALAGLVWFVQVVHYPLMRHVGADGFAGYERQYTRRTTWIVGPLMLVEASTAVIIAVVAPTDGALARLVATNWGRTEAWTARSVLAFGLLWAVAVT